MSTGPETSTENSNDVAVVGMACRFPGASGTESFWDHLAAGRCEIREIPPERWDWRQHWGDPQAERNKTNSRWGSFIEGVDLFDASFFSISPRDAEILDPQQRIMLELAWSCFEDAGIRPSAAWGSRTGVFMGSAILDYKELLEEQGAIEAQYAAGIAHSVIASRISHWYNLRGPSVPMDTACASSLYAIHLAIRSLQRGECSMAFAGGINILLTPRRYISFAKMGILSPTGRCRSFDDAADGTVRGEGAGLLLLKPLRKALEDGDAIHGIIKGSAINHSGKTHTLSYPNPTAQAEVIRDAWRDARVEPETVSSIEAHGTGTPKGDPLELEGLRQAFAGARREGAAEARCAISSVKTNLGHLESAAGIAGVIKVLLSMQRRQLPPLQGFQRLNHRIALEGTPFYMVDRLQEWRGPAPLRAGVSSFGFAGTNAHVVLEEAQAQARPALANEGAPCFLFGLSAKTHDALRCAAGDLLAWAEQPHARGRLCELSAALLGARERLDVRAAFVAKDWDELRKGLAAVQTGEERPNLWRGAASKDRGASAPAAPPALMDELRAARAQGEGAYRAKLGAAAELYAKGADLDLNALAGGRAPRDLRLPPYPFSRERFWVPAGEPRREGAEAWLHPLVQANTSDLTAQRFSSTFTGAEPFLADHRMQGERVLPGAAFLEMARVATALSLPGAREASIRLRDVVFARPLTVGGAARRVDVALAPEGDEEISFEIASDAPEGGDAPIHCHGKAAAAPRSEVQVLDLAAVSSRCAGRALDGAACYAELGRIGFEYGPSHRGLESLALGQGEALGRLAAVSAAAAGAPAASVGTLDSALQAALLLMANTGEASEAGRPPMPFAVEEAELAAEGAAVQWVRVLARPSSGADGTHVFDLELCAEGGAICGRVRGLAVRAPAKVARFLAIQTWEPLVSGAEAAAFAAPERLVLLCEPGPGVAERVRAQLGGVRCRELGAGEGGAAERVARASWAALEEIRALLESKPRRALVQAVFGGAGEQGLYAALGGLLRSAGRENPALFGQVIELQDLGDGARVASALAECARGPLAREVRYRGRARAAARWREVDAGAELASPWKDGGVYLVSGGAGGLGLIVAEEIAREAKRAVIHLAGRSALSPEAARRLLDLEALGCKVLYSQVDVSRREAVDALVAGIVRDHGRLDGVVHSAGVLRDSFIVRKERRELEEVFAGKALGAANLDEATKDLSLDCFILFSSAAGALGNAGQADYAAANAFLDAYASLRAELASAGKRSGRTLSIDWPLWKSGGMRVGAEAERDLRESFGMRAIETRAGLDALRRSLAIDAKRVLYLEGDLPALQRALEGPPAPAAPTAGAPEQLEGARPSADIEAAVALVKREMSQVLKVAPSRMDEAAPMESHGIDSIATVQLTRQLERTFGPLSKTLFFEYRNIRELAGYFLSAHAEKLRSAAPAASGPAPEARSAAAPAIAENFEVKIRARRFASASRPVEPERAEPGPVDIAIIGLAGRYPGARDVREFWANLRDGVNSITEVPPGRWDHGLYFDADKGRRGKTYSKWGGFIDGVDEFNPLFFNVSPREAEIMDPQERLFLQCAYEAVEDAGYTRESLARSSATGARASVGVYVGVMWEEYALYGAQEQARGRNLALSASPASIANRVSYFFDFCGPSMAVDTLCSSSLTAIHLACQSLQRGECEAAIAGGVNVSIHPNKYLWLAQGRYVSSKGRCESFGEGGDGYVPGEGVGAALLKPLARAVADGDSIYGVIRGSALNHGGKTNGFTVPSPAAQANVIGLALARAGVDPRAVSYLEAHGTGTSLGDPIEIAGLAKAFEAKGASEPGSCAIGSAKSNIGHCEGAAGIAGLTKVLLQMKHRQLVPSLHSRSLNPHIAFDRTPFRVQQALAPWERPVVSDGGEKREHPRIAGLSSFGAGGSNAHLIVQEHVSAVSSAAAEAAPRPAVVLLSARDESRLTESARRLLEALKGPELSQVELADIAYTTQVGREAMEERLGLVASSASDLAQKLEQYLGGERETEGVFGGRASSRDKTVARLGDDEDMARTLEAWVEKRKFGKLLPLWVEGLSFDWGKLHRAQARRRVSLPTYPFTRERYWVPASEGGASAAALLPRPALHPLLHENTSDLGAQRYTSTFTGCELFLRDHIVGGRKVLPGAAQLELARAAVAAAAGEAGAGVRLREVVWTAPLAVEGEAVHVSIELAPEESGAIAFEIFRGGEDREERQVFCRGAAILGLPEEGQRTDLAALKSRCGRSELSGAECYTAFQALGVDYGPGHRAIERLFVGEREVLAKLAVPAAAQEAGRGCLLNPSALDGALQCAMGLLVAQAASGVRPGPAKALPFFLEELEVLAASRASMWAHARARSGAERDGALVFDVDLCDEAGHLCARAKGLALRPVKDGSLEAMKAEMLAPVWDAATPPRADVGLAPERVSVIAGADGAQTRALREAHADAAFLAIREGETAESLAEKLGALADGDGLVWVAPEASAALSPEALLDAQELGALHLFRLIKAVLSRGGGAKALSWTVLTSLCIAVRAEDAVDPTHAGVHGLVGVMAREYPSWRVRLVDADGALSAEKILRAPADPTGRAWAVRAGTWYRQRLLPVAGATEGSSLCERGGAYVVIGGAGGVGEVWSEHAIRAYGAQVVWIGRRPLDASIQAKIDRLGSLGPAPRYVQADATSLESLREAHREIKQWHPAVRGVVHSALVLRDKGLAKMTEAAFREAYAAKVDASVRAAEVFGGEPLAFALFFSSTVALQAAPGLGNYAAGCTFEDAYAHALRRAWPCPVKVMNWGFWGEHGAVATDEHRRRMTSAGIGSLAPAEAMEALEALLAGPLSQVAFIKTTARGRLERTAVDEELALGPGGVVARRARPDRAEALSIPRQEGDRPSAPASAPKSSHEAASKDEGAAGPGALRERARRYLCARVGEVLKVPVERVKPSEPLGRYGIDSITVVQLANALRPAFGEVKETLLFEHQTIDALAEELARTRPEAAAALPVEGGATAAVAEVPAARAPAAGPAFRKAVRGGARRSGSERVEGRGDASPVAIVGLAGRYPKSRDVNELWRNLRDGRSCISEVPADRWDWREYYDEEKGRFGALYSKWGGFLDDIGRFDPAFFHVSPREAAQMDPQERLFLETAYACIEEAGYTPASLCASRSVGVFVGAMNANYGNGAAFWSIANRVSFLLDFQGPSLAVDSACSSSLTALHLAVESLQSGTCECAVAGGVNLIVDPLHYARLSAASMLSPGDRCRSFGEGADGMIDGEGVGAVVLKPLDRALADGDHVWAVIRGSMLNAGGRTNGYTVPNPRAQQAVIAQALRRARVSPRRVSYVEAHGTGTELGDPIEIAGLTQAFEEGTADRQFCAIGSAKSNLGHCESAAGIAGLTKVLLQMKHGQLAPSLHAKAQNPRIDFAHSPFTLQRELAEWKRPRVEVEGGLKEIPRIAGISSFGAGGANAHVVVEEPPAERRPRPQVPDQASALMVLSARTAPDLREKARQLAEAVRDGALGDASLADVAYTLQVGREAMAERFGALARSAQELREKLAAFAEGAGCPPGCRRGRSAEGERDSAGAPSEAGAQEAAEAFASGDFEKVLALWVGGSAVDWARLWEEPKPRRVGLPTYPFAGERYWTTPGRERLKLLSAKARQPPAPDGDAPEATPRAIETVAPAPSAAPLQAAQPRKVAKLAAPEEVAAPTKAAMPAAGDRRRVVLRPLAAGGPASASVDPPKQVTSAPRPSPAPQRASVEVAPRPTVDAGRLNQELVESLAKALYLQPGEVELDKKFVDMGLDSIVGVEWIKALNKRYGLGLKATAVYDHPNLRAFTVFVAKELGRRELAPPALAERAPQVERASAAPREAGASAQSLREVLRQVQQGTLSAEEADLLFQALEDVGSPRAEAP